VWETVEEFTEKRQERRPKSQRQREKKP